MGTLFVALALTGEPDPLWSKGPPALLEFTSGEGDVTKQVVMESNRMQEATDMCWATCSEMIMETVAQGERIRQCWQATNALGWLGCCDFRTSVAEECAYDGWPDFPNWRFQCVTNTIGPLEWVQITREIDERRPFAYAYSSGEVTHMMVIKGYQIVDGQKQLLCLNPIKGQPCLEPFIDFEDYTNRADLTGRVHVKDFLGVRRPGGQQ